MRGFQILKRNRLLLVMVITGAMGTILLVATRATVPTVSFEPESGTRTSNANVTTDSTASGNSAIRFSEASVGGLRFPTIDSAGTPDGWTPTQTINGDYTVSTAGAVVENIRVNGRLLMRAQNVTIRNVEVNGGDIHNAAGTTCYAMTVENTSILGGDTDSAVARGNYTLRNVLANGANEGPRIGGGTGCGPVTIEHSFVRIVSPVNCADIDWHGDALQGYQGAHLTVRDSVLWNNGGGAGCNGANAAFFYPNQENTSVDVDGLIVRGGGYSFRLGTPGSVQDLYAVNDSWAFGPILVTCSLVTSWNANRVTLDAQGQPVIGSAIPCDTEQS